MDQEATTTKEQAAFERQRSLGYQVNHLARLLAQSIRVRIEPLGVVPGQFPQLLALYEQDGLTQTELCERVRIDQSTMAHTLKRMERDGLVTRTRGTRDRRQVQVHLTDHALEIRDELENAARRTNALALQDITPTNTEKLLDTLAAVIANLETDLKVSQNR